jgi:tape measure domain-containing protein
MPSIDERVVSMAFENAVFEQRIAVTMGSLTKLNDAIAKTGTGPNGLENIEKSANKVTLNAPMSAIDKLKQKLGGGVDAKPIADIEKAGQNVTLQQPAKAIDNLQNKLDKGVDPRGIQNLEKASQGVTLETPVKALEGLISKFSVLEGAASVAFGNIASKAAMKGVNFAKGFGIGPILDGLHEYETNLKAIQTIQANTDQPLTKINKSLQELNHYSDQTIYNFSEMARNIGTFTAAGVDLKTATSSIKGIANMAALSGSSSQQAATAMYQLSQAIAGGKVGLQDWNSVVNAGMGGKKLQNALAQTAVAMGDISGQSVKMEGPLKKLTINGQSFRESIMAKPGQKPWLSSDVLVNTLATLDGRFSKAALSTEKTKDGLNRYTAAQVEAKIATNRTALEQKNGVKYTDEQFKALMKLSDSAFKSATEVKTLGQVFDVAKETIGSGWSASFQSIFGNLTEAKKTFTELSGAINGMINANALARNQVLHDWKAMGGRTDLINGIKNVFHALMAVLGTVKDAFREVFPAKTGKDLAQMTDAFLALSKTLTPNKDTLENLKRTLAGFFAVVHIGWTIIKSLAGVLFDLLGIVGKGSGGFLNFTGGIGDFLVSVDKAVSKGGALTGFFKGLTNILRVPIELIKSAASAIFGLFGGFDAPKAEAVKEGLDKVSESLTPMEQLANRVKAAWEKLGDAFDRVSNFLAPIFGKIKDAMSTVGDAIAEGFRNIDFDQVLLGFQTGFLGGILLVLKKAFSGGAGDALSGGLLGSIKETLGAVTGQLTAMQKSVQANTILKIAGAVVILAAGIFILSTIPPKKLAQAMTAIAVGLGELGAALKLMESGKLAVATMPVIAASMLILAGAVVILAAAMKIMATMSWEEIAKGLAGIAGALTAVGLAIKVINPATIIPIGAGLLLVGTALNIIAIAAKIFAEMSWEEMAKGLAGIGGAMLVLAAGLALMGPSVLIVGPGLVAAAIGMTLMAGAVSAMGAIDPKKMLSGILGLGLALSALGIALLLIPPTMALQAAGLVVLGVGLTSLAGALAIFGSMPVAKLAKGIISMGLALGVLAVGMALMVGSAAGSASFMLAAAGLAIFVPTLALMGALPWGIILKGLAAIALSMGVIAVVGAVAAPGITALGTALLVLGAALVLIGGAVYLTGQGLAALGDTGVKGVAVLMAAITGFVALLPTLVINFVKGLVGIIEEIAKVAPKVVVALGVILDTVIAFVAEHAVKFGQAVGLLIDAILEVFVTRSPAIIAAGMGLIVNLLTGLANNIETIVTKAGEIITKFLNGLSTQAPRIVASGAKLVASYLNGIANNMGQVIAAAANVVTKFLGGVTNQLPKVISKGATLIVTFLNGLTANIGRVQAAGVRLIVKYIDGIGEAIPQILAAGVRVVKKLMDGIATAVPELADAGAKAIIKLLNGIERAIRNNSKQIRDAGWGIADAIVDGMLDGFKELWHKIEDLADSLAKKLPGPFKKVLGIHSPSSVFAEIGKFTMLGLADGLAGNSQAVLGTAENIGSGVIGAFKDMFQIQSPSKVLKEIGKEVGHGFRDGLLGSADSIKGAFASLRGKINQELATQRDNLKQEKDKLADLQKQYADKIAEIADLRSKKKPDKEAINSAQEEANALKKAINSSIDSIQGYKSVIASLKDAKGTLTQDLQDEKKQLMALSKEYEVVTAALDMANQALVDAKRTRDDALKSYTEQFSQLPDWDNLLSAAMAEADMTYEELAEARRKKREEAEKKSRINQVELYKKALQDQIEATKRYQETLAKLRELGLDDATYKKLLAKGLEGQDFASQLLATGKSGVDNINKLDADLLKVAGGLATDASQSLYQAGVNAAQGLVDGLKAKQADLAAAMKSLASTIVSEIKRQLGIRSPSKVFAEIGKNANDGLAKGLTDTSKSVVDAAGGVGDDAAKAMTKSLSNISDAVNSNIDVNPTITPVLDLSQVRKEAKNMPPFAAPNVTPITAAASYQQAASISASEANANALIPRGHAGGGATALYFEQNNYSPKALSDIEVYRQTNNLLSNVKRGLRLPSAG